jgi:hypothetical protein
MYLTDQHDTLHLVRVVTAEDMRLQSLVPHSRESTQFLTKLRTTSVSLELHLAFKLTKVTPYTHSCDSKNLLFRAA